MAIAKKKKYKASEQDRKAVSKLVPCPLRGPGKGLHIDVVVCGQTQTNTRSKCEAANGGNGCEYLDFTEATEAWETYRKAKGER